MPDFSQSHHSYAATVPDIANVYHWTERHAIGLRNRVQPVRVQVRVQKYGLKSNWSMLSDSNTHRTVSSEHIYYFLFSVSLPYYGRPVEYGRSLYFCPVVFFLSSFFFFFFPRLISAVGDWMSTILLHIVWP